MNEINGVLQQKLFLLEKYYSRIKKYIPETRDALKNNWERQKALERMLQVMIEIMIDISDRIISIKGLPAPPTSSESLSQLEDMGIIKSAADYASMVRFRNFIVHRYEDIDIDILFDILTKNLSDFKKFINEINEFIVQDN